MESLTHRPPSRPFYPQHTQNIKPATGRQVNSYKTLPVKKSTLEKPRQFIIEKRASTSRPRHSSVKTLSNHSKSPPEKREASASTKRLSSMEDKAIMVHLSRPRQKQSVPGRREPSQIKETPQKEKPKSRETSPVVKKLINNTLNKFHHTKKENKKQELIKEKEKETQRRTLQEKNETIRKRNAKSIKRSKKWLHKTAWGVDEREYELPTERYQENDIIRNKKREEREKGRKEGRDRIGLAYYSRSKVKKQEIPPKESVKETRVSDRNIIKYMEIKKEQIRIQKLSKKLQEAVRGNEREKALLRLERKQRIAAERSCRKKKNKKKTGKKGCELEIREEIESKTPSELRYKFEELKERVNAKMKTPEKLINLAEDHELAEEIESFEHPAESEESELEIRSPRFGIKEEVSFIESESSFTESLKLGKEFDEFKNLLSIPNLPEDWNPSNESDFIKDIDKFEESLPDPLPQSAPKIPSFKRRLEINIEEINEPAFYDSDEINPYAQESSDSQTEQEFSENESFSESEQLDFSPTEKEELSLIERSEKIEEQKEELSSESSKLPTKEKPQIEIIDSDEEDFEPEDFSSSSIATLEELQEEISEAGSFIEEQHSSIEPEKFSGDIDWLVDLEQLKVAISPARGTIYEDKSETSESLFEHLPLGNCFLPGIVSTYSEDLEPPFPLIEDPPIIKQEESEIGLYSYVNDERFSYEYDSYIPDYQNISIPSRESTILSPETELVSFESVVQPRNDLSPSVSYELKKKLPVEKFIETAVWVEDLLPKPVFSPRTLEKKSEEEIMSIILKEINTFLEIIPFENREPEVDTSLNFVCNYAKKVMLALKPYEEGLIHLINIPLYTDPLEKLCILQNTEVGRLIKSQTLDLILSPDVVESVQEEFNPKDQYSTGAYLQMLLDCINESLNYIRPYELEGVPSPWSQKLRTAIGECSLEEVFGKVEKYMVKWISFKGGELLLEEEMDKVEQRREERMSLMLCEDALAEEKDWLNYEDEDLQVVFDISEMVLEFLTADTLSVLSTAWNTFKNFLFERSLVNEVEKEFKWMMRRHFVGWKISLERLTIENNGIRFCMKTLRFLSANS